MTPKAINDTIWRTRLACLIFNATREHAHAHAHAPGQEHARMHAPKRTHTHRDEYVILITFARQEWFREQTSM